MYRASPALSSISRTGIDLPAISRAPRQLDDAEPEVLDGAHDAHELIEIDRLGDVTVGVEVVARQDVLVGVGRGQHDHGNPAKVLIVLDLGKDLLAVEPWEVEIEEDEIGAGSGGVFASAVEEIEGILGIGAD